MTPAGVTGGRVQITMSALPSIQPYHIHSAIDLSIAVPEDMLDPLPPDVVTGFSEWAADWPGGAMSIGWDWGVIDDFIVVVNPTEIRTNIELIDDNGVTQSAVRARVKLLEWIESLPWRALVEDILPRFER